MAQNQAILLRRLLAVVVAAIVGTAIIAFFAHRHSAQTGEGADPTIEQIPEYSNSPTRRLLSPEK